MKIPIVCGVIERRLLLNYHVDPAVLARQLPPPFRPQLHGGWGLAGICLIRLRGVRPRGWPAWLGFSSENAAHRVAVEWDDHGTVRQGVFVRRRDSNSRLNALLGGRFFPGAHAHARFEVAESEDRIAVAVVSDDGGTDLAVTAQIAGDLGTNSCFASLADAALFFQSGSIGYSATATRGRFDGLRLNCHRWQVEPLAITTVRSNWFDNQAVFPAGSIAWDCGLLMRNIEHEWHGLPDLRATSLDVPLSTCAV